MADGVVDCGIIENKKMDVCWVNFERKVGKSGWKWIEESDKKRELF